MTPYTYFGGPMDGGILPPEAEDKDYVIIETEVQVYYYSRCDDHAQFEYVGEMEDWYE